MNRIVLAIGLILLAVTAAHALDCAAPATPAETVLCTDTEVQALDATLGNALKVALDHSRQADRDVLTANQQSFIDNRNIDCDYDETGDPETPDGIRECLLDETGARVKYLTGVPLEGPGPGTPMVPQVLAGKDGMFVLALRFADPRSPGEKLFNHMAYEALKDIHLARDDTETSDSFVMVLAYASPALLSASVELTLLGANYAHPMPSIFSLNVDLANGKELTLADAFDARALKQFEKLCETQLVGYISASENGADDRRGDVERMVGSLRSWTFGATAARLAFIDQFMDNPQTCTLGYDVLRPVVKASFPLPS